METWRLNLQTVTLFTACLNGWTMDYNGHHAKFHLHTNRSRAFPALFLCKARTIKRICYALPDNRQAD